MRVIKSIRAYWRWSAKLDSLADQLAIAGLFIGVSGGDWGKLNF